MTAFIVLPACKAFPTHILTTFSPTCHPDPIFSAPVLGTLWARCQADHSVKWTLPPTAPVPQPPNSSQPLEMASFKKKIFWFQTDPHLWLRCHRPLGKVPLQWDNSAKSRLPGLEGPGK